MSRPQHRKSQSTSALSIIASSPARPSRASRDKARGGLERVEEVSSTPRRDGGSTSDASKATVAAEERSTPKLSRSARAGKTVQRIGNVADVKGWMNDILSIRSSNSKRLAALRHTEELLLRCCLGGQMGKADLVELLNMNIHTNLLTLLTRHAQLLASRAHSHSSLHSTDETAIGLVPELTAVFGLLQGLCLLSGPCKAACAEDWTIEMLIDILLLLRSIPAANEGHDSQMDRPVVYYILELLFCILVDSPEYSRTFERLSGLEAVTRVLKGSNVVKEVRMKCIEFLYFYLLPEHQARSLSSSTRSTSSSTSRSASSTGSVYPPSPLDRSSHTRQPPMIIHPQSPGSPKRTKDLDLNFVPQTPRKKVTPNLGYLTPSSRRVSTSTSAKSTPALLTVPASPVDTGSSTPRAERRASDTGDAEVGLGLGLPNSNAGGGLKRDVTAIHLGALVASPESNSRRRESRDTRTPPTSSSSRISHSSTQPNLSALTSSQRQTSLSSRRTSRSPLVQSSIPESPKSSPQVEERAAKTRHSHTPLHPVSDTDGPSDASSSSRAPRVRHSQTSSQLSSFVEFSSSSTPPIPRAPKIRHSMTSSRLSSGLSDPPPTESQAPQIRHSRTSSHLSALSPDLPPPTSHISRSPSGFLAPAPSASHSRSASGETGGVDRTPSKAKRAFPSELTRGMLPPPSPASPRSTPLGNSRRLPSVSSRLTSGSVSDKLSEKGKSEVRSVEEKKQLLGQWIGNVDDLVSGVEGAAWWGAQGKQR